MRLIILAILFYFAYRLFIAPLLQGLRAPEERDEINTSSNNKSKDNDYIDYEEVD